jgi:hypothetical protein
MLLRTTVAAVLAVALLGGCASRQVSKVDRVKSDSPGNGAGAVVANVWYTPGRAITCAGGAILAGVVMSVTFGALYDESADVMHGACGGPWFLTSADVR